MTALRRLARVAPLAAVGVAGFLLGSCGGGESALTTATGLTATRPDVTATRPAVPTRTTGTTTAPTTTEETATEPPRTVTTEETTTEPPVTVTTVETETTILPPRTTTEPTPTTTATAAEPASSTSSSAWGWVALAIALAGAALIALLLWRRRRTQAAAWSRHLADLSRRSLLALDDVVAEGSLVTGQVQALADEARSLESSAPEGPSRASAAALRVRLDDLASALEADRKLRLGSTPPSEEQLAYSTSLVHHQLEQLQDVLRPAAPGQRPA
jgi:hypothetical protein